MKLNGWIRIGVVLSALWMVGASAYYFSEDAKRRSDLALYMAKSRSDCLKDNYLSRLESRPERPCAKQEDADYLYDTPWLAILVLPTIYLVLAWIVIGIAYGSIRWIWKGFKA